jgi:hypothetical protein
MQLGGKPMPIRFVAMPTDLARAYQSGALDAYAMTPEERISDGAGVPCRHCLQMVAAGKPYLVMAYRPFPTLQPYAETGPIFLCAEACERAADHAGVPAMMCVAPDFIVRGYGNDDRIVYGTGSVVDTKAIAHRAEQLLAQPDIAYLHVRSARNNCYQCRIDRS